MKYILLVQGPIRLILLEYNDNYDGSINLVPTKRTNVTKQRAIFIKTSNYSRCRHYRDLPLFSYIEYNNFTHFEFNMIRRHILSS